MRVYRYKVADPGIRLRLERRVWALMLGSYAYCIGRSVRCR